MYKEIRREDYTVYNHIEQLVNYIHNFKYIEIIGDSNSGKLS